MRSRQAIHDTLLSGKARKLYDALVKRNGGVVPEYKLRDATGLSHGSFIAPGKSCGGWGLSGWATRSGELAIRLSIPMNWKRS